MAAIQQPINRGRPNPSPTEQMAQAPRPAKPRKSGQWPLFVRILVSLFVLFHLFAVFIAPMSMAVALVPRREIDRPLAVAVAQQPPVQWYLDALYLNHGYSFFAPDPGEGHLIRFQVYDDRGAVIKEGEFPSKTDYFPRLRYHRYFMLAEQCQIGANSEAADKQWQQAYLKNYAQELLREYGGQTVRVQRWVHWPLHREDAARDQPMKLEDIRTYEKQAEVTQRRQDLDLPPPSQNQSGARYIQPTNNQPMNNQIRRDIASGWQGERR